MISFAEIEPGAAVQITKTIVREDVEAFAKLSGDNNPLHLDQDFAQRAGFSKPVVHGMLIGSYVSTLIGTKLPGAGALWTRQSFEWPAPVFEADTITVTLRVIHKSVGVRAVTLEVNAVNQHGTTVMKGEGTVKLLEHQKSQLARPMSEMVALVAGAEGEIGECIVRELQTVCAGVVAGYSGAPERVEALCRELAGNGKAPVPVKIDSRDPGATQKAVEAMREQFGQPVGILICNASGEAPARPFEQLAWSDMQEALDTNLTSAFNLSQAVLPGMIEQKSGSIVSIGSVWTQGNPPPQMAGFVAAKAALHGLMRCLAVEYGPKGIRANTVAPGLTDAEPDVPIPERMRKLQAMQAPARRLATPGEIAQVVRFLCSEGANYITGASIPVCGGAYL
jgi:3-oxoacyl-[acyl-carrier protein] reductase